MAQLHKKFTDAQVKEVIIRYLNKEIQRSYIEKILGIKRRRFCELVKKYREDPEEFSIEYKRKVPTIKIDKEVENNIMSELKIENKLINNPDIPIRSYNYSYIKDRLETDHDQKVSLPTIINRAKKEGFYLGKRKNQPTIERY